MSGRCETSSLKLGASQHTDRLNKQWSMTVSINNIRVRTGATWKKHRRTLFSANNVPTHTHPFAIGKSSLIRGTFEWYYISKLKIRLVCANAVSQEATGIDRW